MSYNIDTFKLKKLENLKIPLASFYKHERKDFHPRRINNDDGSLHLKFGESSYLDGSLDKNEVLSISKIDWCGEFSGTAMMDVLEPALEESTGELIASCVWEGGDSINRLVVKDGVVSWEEIEL